MSAPRLRRPRRRSGSRNAWLGSSRGGVGGKQPPREVPRGELVRGADPSRFFRKPRGPRSNGAHTFFGNPSGAGAMLAFYTEKLGFIVATDQPFDDHQRWI